MATTLAEPTHAAETPTAPPGWLVHPWFDLLFIANIGWPLLLLAQLDDGFTGKTGIQFWQLYWITTPHRWITLVIVFLDRERLAARRGTFLTLALIAVALCATVQSSTGALTCLMAIDYVWNAWHFASQHHGVYRIYDRLSPCAIGASPVHKWTLRVFLLYVIIRVATATWTTSAWHDWSATSDVAMLVLPIYLILREVVNARPLVSGRGIYLASTLGLYVSLLAAVHVQRPGLVMALATASALFHALEYLTLVSWSVRRRQTAVGTQMGVLGWLVPRWAIALALFMLILGAGAWMMDQSYKDAWLFLNVIAAFLHYAYDGLIWRRA